MLAKVAKRVRRGKSDGRTHGSFFGGRFNRFLFRGPGRCFKTKEFRGALWCRAVDSLGYAHAHDLVLWTDVRRHGSPFDDGSRIRLFRVRLHQRSSDDAIQMARREGDRHGSGRVVRHLLLTLVRLPEVNNHACVI